MAAAGQSLTNIAMVMQNERVAARGRKVFLALVTTGVLLRLISTLVASTRVTTPWRVGGDVEFYVRLASTVAHGGGFTYAGLPTAFRPPLYPLLLAGMMKAFGNAFPLPVRCLQCAVGLATVWLCGRIAARLFGQAAGRVALLIGLYFPTLSVFPTELMTECLATFLSAAFFYFILGNQGVLTRAGEPIPERGTGTRTRERIELSVCSGGLRPPQLSISKRRRSETAATASIFSHLRIPVALWCAGLGGVIGLATLLRFNMAILGPIAVCAIVWKVGWRRALPQVALLTAVAALIVSPWIVRNLRVFHGRVLLSNQGGYNALQGVLAPQGRSQAGDLEALRAAGAWWSADLESNGPPRLALAPEPELDRQAWELTWNIWRQRTWRLLPVLCSKLGYFWLSTDQLLSTRDFPVTIRVERAAGVALYWALLAFAIAGWVRLRKQQPAAATFVLAYVGLITLAHLPFIMSSRHRISFADALLVILAAGVGNREQGTGNRELGVGNRE